jgi:membrane fusion protein (multidrug efflux system)
MKRILFAVLLLAVILGGVFGYRAFVSIKMQEAMSNRQAPPTAVAAMEAPLEVWKPCLEAVGSLEAVQGVDVTGELPGLITEITFSSGENVNKGKVLVKLDTSADRAQLRSLVAARELAEIQFKRMKSLVAREMSPQSDLDIDEARFKQADAEVDRQRVQIEKKQIKAPFSGQLGIRRVNLGQYLDPGTPIVSLQALAPIYVNFSLPQQHFQKVSVGQSVAFTVNTWPDQPFSGTITAIPPKVNEATRNFELQATLPNTDKRLKPGMFGTVCLELPETRELITIPQTAVSFNPYGDVVFVLQPTEDKAKEQKVYRASRTFVTTGETRGDQVAIHKGLEPGQMVVISGQHKLREGARAVINNSTMPDNDPSPQLQDM